MPAVPDLRAALLPVPPAVSLDLPLGEAIAHFSQPDCTGSAKRVRCLVILDGERLIGTLNARNLLRGAALNRPLAACTVADVMTHEPLTIEQARLNDLSILLGIFHYRNLHHLPVVDANQRLIGVLTPSSLWSVLPLNDWLSARTAAEVMTTQCICVPPAVSIQATAQMLVANKASHAAISLADNRGRARAQALISERDIADWYVRQDDLSQPVEAIANTPLLTLSPQQAPVAAGLSTPADGYPAQLVVDAEQAVLGIVTARSILQVFDARNFYVVNQTLDRKVSELESTTQNLRQEIKQRTMMTAALADERNLLGAILDSADALLVVLDRRGRVLHFNQACEQLSGYDLTEVFRRPLAKLLLPPEERAAARDAFQRLFQGATSEHLDLHWCCRNGDRHLIAWSGTTLPDAAGNAQYIVGTGVDITEHQTAKQALQTRVERYASLAAISPVGIFRNDLEGRCVYANQPVLDIVGLPLECIDDWSQAVHPDDRDRVLNEWQAAWQTRALFRSEYRFVRPTDGQTLWVLAQAVPERNEQGETIGFVGTVVDITKRKQADAEVRRFNEELERRVAQRTADLQQANQQLQAEIAERERVKQELWVSQAKLQDLFEHANDLIQSVDLTTGHFLLVNRTWHTLLGYTQDELTRLTIQQVLHPASYQRYRQLVGDYIQGCAEPTTYADRSLRLALTFVTRAKTHLRLDGNINCRCLRGGQIVTQEFFRDVTARREAEQALRESEARYRRIVETAGEGIWAIDEQGKTTFANDIMAAMLGVKASEMLGRTLLDFMDEPERDVAARNLARQREGTVARYELPFRHADGTTLWTLVSTTPILDKAGRYDGALAMVADISDRHRAEAEIRQALARAQELNELKSRFIATTSHEFRTPLSVIGSSAGILKTFGHRLSVEKRQEHLETIQKYVQHTTALLDDILMLNRAEAGKLYFKPEPLDLPALCQTIVQEIGLSYPERSIRCECSGELRQQPVLDRKLIRQILINLLTNAAKYSPEEAPIDLTLDGLEGTLVLRVRDRGIGIPVEDQARLFEAFHRAGNVGTTQGTGLGLSIVQKCVELHRGHILISSLINEGTTLAVVLPYDSRLPVAES